MKTTSDILNFDLFITSSFDIAYALSKALDLVNPLINNHHQRVAFIAGMVAKELGLKSNEIEDIIISGLIHDIGVVVEAEFHELVQPENAPENEFCHVMVGSYLLKDLHLFPNASLLVKYHHSPYGAENNPLSDTDEIPEGAYILHLADKVDVLLDRSSSALDQRGIISENINKFKGIKFKPEHVDAFNRLAEKEHFWFDIEENEKYRLIKYNFDFSHLQLNQDGILETAKLLSRIIDFRCAFTSTHSAGVAAVAHKLAELAGYSEKDCKSVMIAGYLHDIGKLAIPADILYKDGKLSNDEKTVMSKHPYYTYSILNSFQIFEKIKDWASFHHEALDGSGYPFHLSGNRLDMGSRIMAVADIFTAITEDRPYRKGEDKKGAMMILEGMVGINKLDSEVVKIVGKHFDIINKTRKESQNEAQEEFKDFKESIFSNTVCCTNKGFITVFESN
jgi:putative nucleotidyltransferase with HDIG domain